MLVKKIIYLIFFLHLCRAQNILNFLDFAAPIFGLLKAGAPEVCYEDLGCFRNDGPFSASPFRPISCVPQSPQIIGTEFLFFSRKFPEEPHIIEALDSHLFKDIEFDPNKNTKIVTHGYKEGLILHGFSHDTFEVLKDGLLHNEDSNVIVVRWSRGASGFYFQSVANCRVVAAEIAHLINYLISERKARPESFHLIGFSLGAHISGFVGKRVKNLGKITALDPAKPYFDGASSIARLASTDALFIEGLHSDSGIGTEIRVGTIDIYFNGGNKQPGCDRQVLDTMINDGILDGIFEKISCDHKRALHYYVDYLFRTNTECIPIAYRCQNWNQFMSGLCTSCGQSGEKCVIIGLNTQFNTNLSQQTEDYKYFMLTNDRQPFCVYQYLVKITTHSTQPKIDGNFHFRLHSHNNTFIDQKSRHFELSLEKDVSFVISSESPLKEIRKIDLTFIRSTISKSEENPLFISSMKLIPLNIIDDNEKLRNSINYCTPNNKWLANSQQNVITLRSLNCI